MKPYETLTHGGQVRRLKRLAQAALDEYDLHVVQIKPLAHIENTTFHLWANDGSQYVLRITRPGKQDVSGVRSEMQWLAALQKETALVVPNPVPTRNGDLLTIQQVEEVPEPRLVVLFHWVEGRRIDDRLTPTHLHRVGSFTAHLHTHASRWRLPDRFQRGPIIDLSDEAVERTLALIGAVRPADDVRVVAEVIERMRTVLSAIGQHPDRYGLIHADLHQWNYLFHNGEVRAIDFDDCGFAPFLYDLSVTLFEVHDRATYPALQAALLAGYRAVRPLPNEYETYLETFFHFRRLQLLHWEIEMRHHPAFKEWATWATERMVKLRAFVEAS